MPADSIDSTLRGSDLLLHPLRMRIIQLLLQGRQLTASQIAAAEPAIPRATLYRHLNQLVAAGVLMVAEERQVRNLTEKVYALTAPSVYLDPSDTVSMSKDDLMRLFTAFATLLMSDFERYLRSREQGEVDFWRDGVSFWQKSLLLNPQEARRLLSGVNDQLAEMRGRPAPDDGEKWLVSFAIMPAGDGATSKE